MNLISFFRQMANFFIDDESEFLKAQSADLDIHKMYTGISMGMIFALVLTLSSILHLYFSMQEFYVVDFISVASMGISFYFLKTKKAFSTMIHTTLFAIWIYIGYISLYLEAFSPNLVMWYPIATILCFLLLEKEEAQHWLIMWVIGYFFAGFYVLKNGQLAMEGIGPSMGIELVFNIFNFSAALFVASFLLIQYKQEMERAKLIIDEQKRKIIEASNESMTLFSMISHDLSTPLMVIKSQTDKLCKENPTDRAEVFKKLSTQIDSAIAIVTDARIFKAVKEGKKELELTSVDLKQCVDRVIEIFEDQASKKGITIENSLPEDLPRVIADAQLLAHQVLGNIVSNAIKFSPPRGKIKIFAETSEKGEIVLRIQDFGMGMPEELIAKIFDFHEFTSRKGTAGEKGTGFGLPISKNIMAKLGGDIRVVSVEGDLEDPQSGTIFELDFIKAA